MPEILKIIHFLSLAAGIGVGVANMVIGIRAATAEGLVIGALRGTQGALGRISFIAILLLWVTGLWLWFGYHDTAASPLFIAKIIFVLILTAASLDMNIRGMKAAKSGPPIDPAYAKRAGMIMMAMAFLAVCTAVINFS